MHAYISNDIGELGRDNELKCRMTSGVLFRRREPSNHHFNQPICTLIEGKVRQIFNSTMPIKAKYIEQLFDPERGEG